MPFGLIAKAALAVGKRVVGSHLVSNHYGALAGTVAGSGQSLLGGVSLRLLVVVGGFLYATDPTVKHCVNACLGSLKDAVL